MRDAGRRRAGATVDLSGTVAVPDGNGSLQVDSVSLDDKLTDLSLVAAPGEVEGLGEARLGQRRTGPWSRWCATAS
jgi:hypothetical protein